MTLPGGVLPYEELAGARSQGELERAHVILAEGWRLSAAYPSVDLQGNIPWDEVDPARRSWVFRIHCWDMIDILLAAHSRSQQHDLLRPALRVALDWAGRFTFLEVGEDPSGFAWYDMAVGIRAQRLAYVVDAAIAAGLLDGDALELMEACLVRHCRELADDSKVSFHSNHGFYQVAGQLAMARRFRGRLPGMDALFQQGQIRLMDMLKTQFSSEGVHREHSPDYHRMVYLSLNALMEAGLVELDEVRSTLALIEDQLAWFVYPDGMLVNFGDSDSRDMLLSRANASKSWRGDAMRFVASSGRIGSAPTQDLRAFPESGYAVARNSWTAPADKAGYLALNAAFHSRTHKHADDLSLVWFDRGASVFIDSGRYGYIGRTEQGGAHWLDGFWYSDPMRMHVESTRAHNTIELDRQNSPRKDIKPFGSALGRVGLAERGIRFMEGEVRWRDGIRFARTLLWLPEAWLLTLDWVHDNNLQPHEFRQYWHLAPSFSLEREGDGFLAKSIMHDLPLYILPLLSDTRAEGPWLGERGELQGYYSPKEKVVISTNACSFEKNGSSSIFATLSAFATSISVDYAVNEAAASGRNYRLEFTVDGVCHRLRLARPAGGDLSIDYSQVRVS